MTSPATGPAKAPAPLRVVMVDDHAMVIQALAGFLESVEDGERPIRIVGRAGSLREAVQVLAENHAHVVIVDVGLPDGSGLTLVQRIRAKSPTIGLVVLTMYDDDTTLLNARDAGASALVLKSAEATAVLAAVRHAAQHPSEFNAVGVEDATRRREELPKLSPRELEVLTLIAEGAKVSEVATKLFMSASTVKTHIGKVYSKLGAHNRASAVRIAIDLRLIQPGRHGPNQ
ncbi:MAG: response regulator transcription factor [Intrasporangiaceae bacterium]|nr:response regulator transcription factor [Intrasporangiaceae bacterium]